MIGVEADHDRDVAAWDAERADGSADAGGAEGTVGAERVDGHIGANGTAECMEQAADTTDDEVFGGDVYAAEEPFVEAAGSDAAVADEDDAAPEYAVTPEHANAREYADTHEYAVHHEYAERQEPEVSDASNSLAGECSTRHGLAAASDEDDDWFADVDEETPASAFDTPTATLEPALFQGLGDLERLGPASQPDPAPAPMDAGAGGGLAAWPGPDSRSTVAEALERVAVRIRDGDVPLPSDVPSASEEAALAAVLAALLHSRSR